MATVPIRTITLGLAEPHPLSASVLQQAYQWLLRAQERYTEAGYEVQTIRLSTRPLFVDLADWTAEQRLAYAQELQRQLSDLNLSYFSIGPAPAALPTFPLNRLDEVADLLIAAPALTASIQIATIEHGLRAEAALPTAEVILRLARETPEGLGNFRFAMLACVEAGGPFFPAAYHAGDAQFTIGLQGANILTEALQAHIVNAGHSVELSQVTQWLREAVVAHVAPLVTIGQALAQELHIPFGGIDTSPAPMAADSIATTFELCGYGPVGSPGTVAVAAAITEALKSTGLPTCGYCGLMLPILEDAGLGTRWEEGLLHVHQLLLYSAVCGTGLDTIPLAGDCSAERVAQLLLDVATLALRLRKPLSARLFPVPDKQAGERTTFTSPYLTNTIIAAL